MSNTNKQENKQANNLANDLKGLSQLAEDGTDGVFDLVEAMHQNVLSLGGLLGSGKNKQVANKTSGLTGLVYKAIRKTSALSFKGVNLAVAKFSPLMPTVASQLWQGKARNQWLAILNGVLGDHLAETGNPLQTQMQLMYAGRALGASAAAALMDAHDGECLLLVHGLCMNDELWAHDGHEHGEVLAKEHNLLCFYLRYNTGLSVYQNGQQLSELLECISKKRKLDSQLNLLCHSMGGLVSRSALHYAAQDDCAWHKQVNKAIFLGTPHQGAILEKAGNVLDYLLTISPYSAPFAKLTRSRSQGIQDLQHGCISDLQNEALFDVVVEQLPLHINFHAIAGSRSVKKDSPTSSPFDQAGAIQSKDKGDGLVSVASALGRSKKSGKQIDFKSENQWLVSNCGHMELLGVKASELLCQIWAG